MLKAYESAKEAIGDFFLRLSPRYNELQSKLQSRDLELQRQHGRNDILESKNQDLEAKSRTYEQEYLTIATHLDAAEQACAELELDLESLKEEKDKRRVSDLSKIVSHKNSQIRDLKRRLKKQIAEQRRTLHEGVKGYVLEFPKKAIITANHAGFVTYQSPSTRRVYGELLGRNISSIISGSSEEKRKTLKHFNNPIEGWLYTKGKKQETPTKVKVTPMKITSEEEEIMHTTLIEILAMGNVPKTFDAIKGGESCYQQKLRQDILEAEQKEKERQQKIANADAIAEQVRNGNFGIAD